jgi:cyclase
MNRIRVIPCLLLKGTGLVKTRRFSDPTYIGDPCNTVKIFNDKEVDELILLDIDATPEARQPNFDLVREIVSEAFMPVAYGGGIRTVEDARRMLSLGVEKIVVCTAAVETPNLVCELADTFGSQSVVVSLNVKKTRWGNYHLVTHGQQNPTRHDPIEFAAEAERLGAGEIMVNSVHDDGMMNGYDIGLLRSVSQVVRVPTIACGGAGSLQHLLDAYTAGSVNAVAAGSMFVFHGKHRAVLINYPQQTILNEVFNQ